MSRDTAPSPDTAVPEVPTASDEAHGLVNALSHNAAEWGASMHTAWFDRKEASEDALIDFIASLESRSLSSGRGALYDPRTEVVIKRGELQDALSLGTTNFPNAIHGVLYRWLSGSPTPTEDAGTGVGLIAAERERQRAVEGWTPEHDATHVNGELAQAAACYAWPPPRPLEVKKAWPWDSEWWKPTIAERTPAKCGCRSAGECNHIGTASPEAETAARVRDLVKAGALISAEIDRLSRPPAEDRT
jgi:hypothetical protein